MRFWLVWLAVCCSVIGLFTLALVRPNVSPQLIEFPVEVIAVDQHASVAFISVLPKNLTVVSFDEPPNLGRQVLRGRLKQYKGRVEFVVE